MTQQKCCLAHCQSPFSANFGQVAEQQPLRQCCGPTLMAVGGVVGVGVAGEEAERAAVAEGCKQRQRSKKSQKAEAAAAVEHDPKGSHICLVFMQAAAVSSGQAVPWPIELR
jgi:hypothetical protein